jgi:hypothetical protein
VLRCRPRADGAVAADDENANPSAGAVTKRNVLVRNGCVFTNRRNSETLALQRRQPPS